MGSGWEWRYLNFSGFVLRQFHDSNQISQFYNLAGFLRIISTRKAQESQDSKPPRLKKFKNWVHGSLATWPTALEQQNERILASWTSVAQLKSEVHLSIIESRWGDSRGRELHTLRDLGDQSPDFWNEPSVTSQPHETSSPEDYSSLCPQNSVQFDFDLLCQTLPFARQVFYLFSWHCRLLEQPQTAARGCATKLPWSSSCYLRQFVLRCPLFLELILAHLIFLTISTISTHLIYFYKGWFWCDLRWVNTSIHVSCSPRAP